VFRMKEMYLSTVSVHVSRLPSSSIQREYLDLAMNERYGSTKSPFSVKIDTYYLSLVM
jgi:hypothetical protein